MDDLISRQAAIDAIMKAAQEIEDDIHLSLTMAQGARSMVLEIERLPSAEPDLDEWCTDCREYDKEKHHCPRYNRVIREALKDAKPERYTKEELKTFLHGISLRLLSLRSAQHWREDDERAKEIESLAHLYEKVEADMKGKV